MSTSHPLLSVIVPAHQGAEVLARSLPALAASDLPRDRWELIVVDDASTDETSLVAARFADAVVRLSGKPHGPAYARNRGFEASVGDVVVFIDADVCVHPDTLRRFADLFAEDGTVSAVFGAYDPDPPGQGVVSQFRNLLHHYVHLRNAGDAETFWAGCGAVRSSAFAEVGMFDEWHYHRPQIEDIELGRRLRRHGHRILLRPEIQCTHLKHWTLRNVVVTDFQHRGVPWMWLLLQEGPEGAHTLNIKTVEKWCTGLVGTALAAAVAAAVWSTPRPLALSAAALATVLGLNVHLYRFFAAHRGPGFALAVVPLHLLYYITNGISVFYGWLMHELFAEPPPPEDAAAQVETGIATWPPAPARPAGSAWRPDIPAVDPPVDTRDPTSHAG